MGNSISLKKYYVLLFFVAIFLPFLFLAEGNYVVSALILGAVLLLTFLFLKTEIGLYLMVLCLPFIEPIFSFNFLEIPLIDLLSLFVLGAFVIREFYILLYKKDREPVYFPLARYFFAFFAICLVSSLLSHNILGSLWYSFRWVLFFYLAFVVVPFNLIKDLKVLKRVLVLISFGGFLVAVMGFFSLFSQDWADSFFRVQPLTVFNNWIFGDNYNLLAEFLIISSFLSLSLKYWYNSWRSKRLINIFSFVLLLMAFFTFGRTAWITISLQLFLYFFIYLFFIKEERPNLRVFLIPFIVFLFISSPFLIKMVSLQEANVSSTQNRMLLTDISIKAFLNKPLFGYGSGNFVYLVSNNIRFTSKYGDPLDSHGVWQKVIAENGALGLLSFAVFLFFVFRKMYLGVLKNKEDYLLLLPLFVASFGAYFYQFFNTSYYKGRVWIPIALTLVAVFLIENKNKIKKNE
ncbi:hypothetical protein CVU82_02255 [Candidatus Falkowbacteria bacterium HGW-Falkowbacteria-1]|uniref:O-antigen ligase-related domain-containing protein n=1 Tax=Candidatus Falkowbacteria bacterium HGW-Falkowbacteria-1 TaxID=2013768 RepID=A0A2N2E9J7_9BACT|nr:MAG: hypothetical protein CVU82_02255 [Candidatus Falkowbacteria bacterium HGW-Falkowbacteria-1]